MSTAAIVNAGKSGKLGGKTNETQPSRSHIRRVGARRDNDGIRRARARRRFERDRLSDAEPRPALLAVSLERHRGGSQEGRLYLHGARLEQQRCDAAQECAGRDRARRRRHRDFADRQLDRAKRSHRRRAREDSGRRRGHRHQQRRLCLVHHLRQQTGRVRRRARRWPPR